MEISKESEINGKEVANFVIKVSYEAKLRELLRNITSAELKLCIDSCREFIKLLKGDEGGNLLREYIKTSSLCTELVQAWNHRQGKPGLSYVFSLICAILSHPDGMYRANDMGVIGISRALDKFAKFIIDERLNDVCKELGGKEVKCQNAALLLLASIVRRGSGLASDVAKSFDFKLPGFSKLGEVKNRKFEMKRKHFTRGSFVRFALSFLEVGKPGLLRWVLQQREIFSAVLRGLGSDDDEIVVYVLSTLRDRVLVPESLIPPPLRSVLFGSVTLDQLVQISGRKDGGLAAERAAEILNMVCTDPSNGLMPDVNRKPNPLKGNLTRVLGVMKKLKAIEIDCHRDLLLAIVHGRPQFAAAYLDEFPFNLEDHASPNWFAAISLAANVISSVTAGSTFSFIHSQALEPLSINSADLQSILKCIGPRPFTRAVMNKGLLRSQSLVKHGTLRLVFETLKLLDSLFCAINSKSDPNNQLMSRWASLYHEIQDEVRLLLPDPQVLVKLLSSLNKCSEPCLKRAADIELVVEHNRSSAKKLKRCHVNEDIDGLVSGFCSPKDALARNSKTTLQLGAKKLTNNNSNEELDILVGGINGLTDVAFPDESGEILEKDNLDELDYADNPTKDIAELWGICLSTNSNISPEDEETYFFSKLLDTLSVYHRTMPSLLQGSSDFFKLLPSNPLALPPMLQQSLLSLLIEHIGYSSNRVDATRILPQIYKNLNVFLNLLVYSPTKEIRDKSYDLAHAAMLSTGAFDSNLKEIDAWFLFIPFYGRDSFTWVDKGLEIISKQFSVVVSFLCDAVSTTGNNLFKYWNLLMRQINDLGNSEDVSPDFSPLFLCILEKCVRLLGSESGNFSVSEKTIISLYVSNTLKYLLQTQVDAGLLASLINGLLPERLKDQFSAIDISEDFCEWRPLKSLFCFSKSITEQQICQTSSMDKTAVHADRSFVDTLGEVKKVLEDGKDYELAGMTAAFSFSVVCTRPTLIVRHFPSLIFISQRLPGAPVSILSSIFFLEKNLLNCALNLWPEDSVSALERFIAIIDNTRIREDSIVDVDSEETAPVAFYAFLKQAPFHVLFPAFISPECPYLLHPSKLQALLSFKLSEGMADHYISYLQLVLFWFRDIQLSYRTKPVYELEQLSEICINLLDVMFVQPPVGNAYRLCSTTSSAPTSVHLAQEMAKTIFSHPAVTTSLESLLSGSKELSDDIFGEMPEDFLALSREGIHNMDYHVLNILTKSMNHLFSFCVYNKSLCLTATENDTIQKPFKSLIQKLLLIVRERFDRCISLKSFVSLITSVYALHSLFRFICPFELLELAYWMFSRGSLSDPTLPVSSKILSLSIGLGIAARAFDLLSSFQDLHSEKLSIGFRGSAEENSNISLLERVYFSVVDIATDFELPIADHCMLKAIKIANAQKVSQNQCLPLCMVMLKLVTRTPMKIISHCTQKVTITKAQLLFHISEVSPPHQSVFGQSFFDSEWLKVTNHSLIPSDNVMERCNSDFSDDDFMMFLPAAISYLNSTVMKCGNQFYQQLRAIPSLYWKILVGSLSNWKSYVSRNLFKVGLGESVPPSLGKLLSVFHNSILGKSIFMMRLHLAISGASVSKKERLKLFNHISPSAANSLFDNEINVNSLEHCLNLVIQAVAKIHLCRMLFSVDNHVQVLPKSVREARVDFMNTLVHTWQLIVKKFPSIANASLDIEARSCSLYRLLEIFILKNIVELTREICLDTKSESHSFSSMEELAKSCLLHRFEDLSTLSMLQIIFTTVPNRTSFHSSVLQLLLSHSQFAPTIQSARVSSASAQFGMIFSPMSSILKSLVFSSADQNIVGEVTSHQTAQLKPLEIVKLIRVLIRYSCNLSSLDSSKDIGINSEELLFLLLSSYGASVSKLDLEIYNLMHEIEGSVESNSAIVRELDYLWGTAAKRVRREREMEKSLLSDGNDDEEAARERRRTQFRDNSPVDPKTCVSTVLHFPYDRVHSPGDLQFNEVQKNIDLQMPAHIATAEVTQVYDPFFILRFSIHSLSMGYFEPLEFVSLGLLAVTFVSTSSPDDEMRKLGYETLIRFKNALEMSQKRKDVKQLHLLLEYVRNGIKVQWQRIPSIWAVFVAEASFVLLDRSHPHYLTVIGVLEDKPMHMESIPLFHELFWSTSSSYKAERLWMLRLLCAGLNLEHDAKIYRDNSILEILLSFYVSPLSDQESRELILQILKKAVKFYETSRYLVEDCGLLTWLASTISNFYGGSDKDQRSVMSTHLTVSLEVIDGVISSKHITEWLQNIGLEQLAELSSHLYRLLVINFAEIKENIHLINSILEILTTILKVFEKRGGESQPQYTLSGEVLFQLYQVIDVYKNGNCFPNSELALKLILMSTPSAAIFSMGQEKLSKFIIWAVSTAIHSVSIEALESEEYNNNVKIFFEKERSEDSLASKLLRWLSASVILLCLSRKSSRFRARSNPETLKDLFEEAKSISPRNWAGLHSQELLSSTIIYLQHLLGEKCSGLTSVVTAVGLLFFSNSFTGSELLGQDTFASLCSRIRCPSETLPTWKWSFYHPWNDETSEYSPAEKMDENHACQSLLVAFSNVLNQKQSSTQIHSLSYEDAERLGVFKWEKSLIDA